MRGRGGGSRYHGPTRSKGNNNNNTHGDCGDRGDRTDRGDSSSDEKVAGAADGSCGVDTNWYVDSGATNHITGELEKVTMREKYRVKDHPHY